MPSSSYASGRIPRWQVSRFTTNIKDDRWLHILCDPVVQCQLCHDGLLQAAHPDSPLQLSAATLSVNMQEQMLTPHRIVLHLNACPGMFCLAVQELRRLVRHNLRMHGYDHQWP